MSWFSNLFKRRRPHLRQYHVVLPDGTDRVFDLEVRVIEVSQCTVYCCIINNDYHNNLNYYYYYYNHCLSKGQNYWFPAARGVSIEYECAKCSSRYVLY